MPGPSIKTTETNTEIELSTDFITEPLEEFDQIGIEEDLEIIDEVEEPGELPIDGRVKRGTAVKSANFYIDLISNGISGGASMYSGADESEFTLDKEEKTLIAKPLSDMIYDQDLAELKPKHALMLAVLMVYIPIILKMFNLRKENKKIVEAKEVKPELKVIQDNKATEEDKDE